MATKRNTKPALTPAGAARKQLRQAVSNRGKAAFNLWYVYGPKAKRDWVLPSDLSLDCFVYIEACPDIIRYNLDLDPIVTTVGVDNHKTTFDAKLEYAKGTVSYAEFKYASELADPEAVRTQQQADAQREWADRNQVTAFVMSDDWLRPYHQRLQNWRRILPALARARDANIDHTVAEVASRLVACGGLAVRDLVAAMPTSENPHVFAALFRLLQAGRCTADLDSAPLTSFTVFLPGGAQ